MSNKALFFTGLLASVVFLGGMTISETCLAQSHASNNTKTNKQDMSPGGVNAEQYNNTNQNKRHMSPGGVTAEQQGESKQDLELTQKIRQAVVKNKDLSMNAHNVKIITIDGVVTLKGPVASDQEKKAVEELAAQVAGDGNIKSEITIAP
ncbi:MAG: BON domain-containing protein [Desulfomicrobium sp.]|nr:BON domain-containing protein [Desulfomicrobium sp.]